LPKFRNLRGVSRSFRLPRLNRSILFLGPPLRRLFPCVTWLGFRESAMALRAPPPQQCVLFSPQLNPRRARRRSFVDAARWIVSVDVSFPPRGAPNSLLARCLSLEMPGLLACSFIFFPLFPRSASLLVFPPRILRHEIGRGFL